jgi:hypothetical protein
MTVFEVHNHNSQKYQTAILKMYNPWSKKTIWISQINTGSSLKPGSSFKVFICPKPAVLRIWNFWKTTQAVICKNKICPGHWYRYTRVTRGGGGQWNNKRLLGLTSLHKRNLWMCWKSRGWWAQHARQFQLPVRSYWESTATQPITDSVHIKN